MPEVSVVIPMYNGEKFIAQALESVLASEGVTPEIIVVDDGSSDASAQIAESFAGVIVHRQPNGGEAAARKAGYEMATGDFIVFLDCDDLLHPQAIQHHLSEITASDDIDMVFGSNILIDEQGNKIGENIQQRRLFSGQDVVLHTTPVPSQCMYRRSALQRIGGFRQEVRACADTDLNLRLLGWRKAGLCHGKMVMSYRIHGAQMTRSPSRLFNHHVGVLQDVLGPDGVLANPDLLAQGKRYWSEYYGQFIPAEIVRAISRKEAARTRLAISTFIKTMPYSAKGAARFAGGKLKSAFRAAPKLG